MKQQICIFTILFFCFPLHGMMNKLKLHHVRSYRDRSGKQIKMDQWVPGIFFKEFPREIDLCILNQIPTNSDDKIDFKKTLRGINSLAQVNKFFNKFINNNQRILAWIKQLSWQFDIANESVAKQLSIPAAKDRYILQQWKACVEFSTVEFYMYLERGFDLEFTYHSNQITALFGPTFGHAAPRLTNLFIKEGANVNALDKVSRNALMTRLYAKDWDIVKLLLDHPQLYVNHQDNDGNTALHYCIIATLCPAHRTSFIQSEHQLDPALQVINILLTKEANPSIKNEENRTPLEYVLHIKDSYNNACSWAGQKLDNFEIIKALQKAETNWRNRD